MAGVKPWEKKKWRGGEIRPSSSTAVVLLVTGTLFLALGMTAVLKSENAFKLPLNRDNIALLFPVVGLCLTVSAIFMLLRNRKWRGSIGDDTDINITLVNEEVRHSSSGRSSQTSTRWLFKHEMQVNSSRVSCTESDYTLPGIGRTIEVPVDVEIPFETKDDTDNYRSGRTRCRYKWKLMVKADIPGMDLNLEFVLPVYRTEASDPAINLAKKDAADAAAAIEAHRAGRLDFEEIKPDRIDGCEHYVSRGRCGVLLVSGLVILAIGIGVGYSTAMKLRPQFSDGGFSFFMLLSLAGPIIVSGAFVLVGSLLVLLGVYSMGTRDVWVENGQIHYVKRLGSKQWRQTIGRDYIIDITVDRCGSSKGNNFYAVRVEHCDLSQLNRLGQFFYKKAAEKKGVYQAKTRLEIARDIDDKAQPELTWRIRKGSYGFEGKVSGGNHGKSGRPGSGAVGYPGGGQRVPGAFCGDDGFGVDSCGGGVDGSAALFQKTQHSRE